MIYGLDVSLTNTGIAWISGGTGHLVSVKSKGDKAATWTQRRQRLGRLRLEILSALEDAELVVIESPAYGSLTGSAHDRSHLWWSLVESLGRGGADVAYCPPANRAKYATGKGNAGKTAVTEQVARRLGHLWPDLGGDDNVADAAVLCAMGHDWDSKPLVTMPEAHRAALSGVVWPDEMEKP